MRKQVIRLSIFSMIFTLIVSTTSITAFASSHAEAPLISMDRYADNTDIYAFRSTESGRSGYVTLIANFIPFQDPSGGPQFFRFDDTVLYEIHIDNNGDGIADVSYQFQFKTHIVNGNTILGHTAVNQDGVVRSLTDPDYNMPQTYTVTRVRGYPAKGISRSRSTVVGDGFIVPPSNVGPRVTPNYEANLGSQAIYNLSNGGRVFAGQRDEGFFIDVGAVFDGLNFRSLGASGGVDTLRGFNVNSIAIEVPIQDITRSGAVPSSPTADDAVVGIWSTASRRSVRVINPVGSHSEDSDDQGDDDSNGTQGRIHNEGPWRQVSRLGNPLVNEVVIPLGMKDYFNASTPTGDSVFVPAVLDPELPKLAKVVFGTYGAFDGVPFNIDIPPAPRTDLALIFALGIPVNPITGPNYTTVIQGTTKPHEYMRLNLAIAPSANPDRLGLLGGDVAGFPNGRRVFDDVVDIELRAALGGTPFTPAYNHPPNNSVGDGVSTNEQPYLTRFPYLASPNQGNQPRPTNYPAQ